MKSKTIAIVDINNFHKQNIETLLFACVLEKKVNKLSVLDLNHYEQDGLLPKRDHWQKEGEILMTQLFSNTSYQICAQTSPDAKKLLNLAKTLSAISDILVINANSQQHELNSQFYNFADEVVIFADLEKDITKNIMNFFLTHTLKNKKVHLIVHNYQLNIQHEKVYLHLLKQFNSPNITISNIDSVPELKTLQDIENVDPWLEIYKKINSAY
ncbi:MAG: hypothetical protein MJ233_03150 [Mycoplasmoidaceae bacterium]|nr:hypothetical protein [Mycoplasmoidaceae bacterium]